jgi:hypothetical protein
MPLAIPLSSTSQLQEYSRNPPTGTSRVAGMLKLQNGSGLHWLSWGIIAVFTLLHLFTSSRFGLGVDEAHYALYGLKPDWSYFDHPPLTGWLMWPLLQIGTGEIMVRLPTIFLWCLTGILLYLDCERQYHNRNVTLVALALVYLAPLVQLLGFAMVPDTPLVVLTLLLIALLRNMDVESGPDTRQALAMGILVGLAGLSKYVAILYVPALLLSLFQCRALHWLRLARVWLAAIIALVLVSPVFIWNWSHQWVSFSYQLEHGSGGEWTLVKAIRYSLIVLVSFGPLLTLASVNALWRNLGTVTSLAARFRFNLAVLLLAAAVWAAGHGEFLPHWTLLGWVLLAPSAAQLVVTANTSKLQRGLLLSGAVITVLCTLMVWILLLVPPLGRFPGLRQSVSDLHGWREAAMQAITLRDRLAVSADSPVQLWVANWSHASRIAWYTGEPVQVLTAQPSQFSLWWGEPGNLGLLILPVDPLEPMPAAAGHSCELLDVETQAIGLAVVNSFAFYLCQTKRAETFNVSDTPRTAVYSGSFALFTSFQP